MLAFAAAVFFGIALILHATETSTDVIVSPTSLMYLGLTLLALHSGGLGTGWSTPRRRGRRR